MEYLLIKWKMEDCWDVIPFSDACMYDEFGVRKQVDLNGAIIGTEVTIKFEEHLAVILEIGNKKDLEKKCKSLIHEFESKKLEKSLGLERKHIPNRRFLEDEDDNLPSVTVQKKTHSQ